MAFRKHISEACAAAVIHGPDTMILTDRANREPDKMKRIEHLREALEASTEVTRAIQTAIGVELSTIQSPLIPLQPQAAADLCRAVVQDNTEDQP